MTMITLEDAKAHLNINDDADDNLITSQIAAAEGFILSYTGAVYATDADVPAAVQQACRLLVGSLYQNREAVFAMNGTTAEMLPFGVLDLLQAHREWAF